MNNSIPLYVQIKNEIKTDILGHKYQVSQRIPSESELIKQYNVSRITVRRAIQELVEEDFLTKIHGSGTFVRAPKHNRHVVGINSFTTDCLNNGIVPRTRVLALSTVKATDADCKILGVTPGEKIIYLERLRYADDDPVIIERDYLPPRFSSLLWESHVSLQSIAHLIEDRFKVKIGPLDATIEIAIVYKQEAKLLELRPNSPVLLVKGCTYDVEGVPLYRSVQIFSGDKFKVNISKNASWEG
ncbi:MAG: GntR family transcriptional regulator [Bacillota bacterium]